MTFYCKHVHLSNNSFLWTGHRTNNLVSGFADRVKTLLNHFLSARVEVVGADVERKRLEPWTEDVDNAIGKYNIPEQQCKQCLNGCAFSVHAW